MTLGTPPAPSHENPLELEVRKLRKKLRTTNIAALFVTLVLLVAVAFNRLVRVSSSQKAAMEVSSSLAEYLRPTIDARRLALTSKSGQEYQQERKEKGIDFVEYFRPTNAQLLRDIGLSGEARSEVHFLGIIGAENPRIHLEVRHINGPRPTLWLNGEKQTFPFYLARIPTDAGAYHGNSPGVFEVTQRIREMSRRELDMWVGSGEERLDHILGAVGYYCPEKGIHWVVVGPKETRTRINADSGLGPSSELTTQISAANRPTH